VQGPCGDDVVRTENDCGLVLPGKAGIRALCKARTVRITSDSVGSTLALPCQTPSTQPAGCVSMQSTHLQKRALEVRGPAGMGNAPA